LWVEYVHNRTQIYFYIILVVYRDFHTLLGHELEPQLELKNQISWAELSKAGLYKSRAPDGPGD